MAYVLLWKCCDTGMSGGRNRECGAQGSLGGVVGFRLGLERRSAQVLWPR